ncbi:MAG: phage tail tape measure protein, partial [Candidatus Ornithomonoglobus sp.]
MAGGKELKLAISIGAKIDKSLGSAINNAEAQLSKIGSGVNKVAKAVTVATAAAGVKLVSDSIEAYTTYESALSKTAATAGVEKGSAAYNQLNEAAREAGRTTVKTAQESAEALGYMALAGWNVEDSTKALMPVLKLSASTGTELATTSDLVTDSMANLGLGINDLNRYLDVSVAANNKSNQSATQLMEAYLGVGGVLNNLNSPIEESAAILGVLANRGTKGSEAGTALNAILVNMQKKTGDASKAMSQLGVSMYDQNGNARKLTDVFQDISDKTSG